MFVMQVREQSLLYELLRANEPGAAFRGRRIDSPPVADTATAMPIDKRSNPNRPEIFIVMN